MSEDRKLSALPLAGTLNRGDVLYIVNGGTSCRVPLSALTGFVGGDLTLPTSRVSDFTSATDARINAQKGQPLGVATLDAGGKVAAAALPALALVKPAVVASQAAQLALAAQEGDLAVRSDQSRTYMNNGGQSGSMSDWTELLSPTNGVQSFNSRQGAVSLTTGDVTAALGYTPAGLVSPAFTAPSLGAAGATSLAVSGAIGIGTAVPSGYSLEVRPTSFTPTDAVRLPGRVFVGSATGGAAPSVGYNITASNSYAATDPASWIRFNSGFEFFALPTAASGTSLGSPTPVAVLANSGRFSAKGFSTLSGVLSGATADSWQTVKDLNGLGAGLWTLHATSGTQIGHLQATVSFYGANIALLGQAAAGTISLACQVVGTAIQVKLPPGAATQPINWSLHCQAAN